MYSRRKQIKGNASKLTCKDFSIIIKNLILLKFGKYISTKISFFCFVLRWNYTAKLHEKEKIASIRGRKYYMFYIICFPRNCHVSLLKNGLYTLNANLYIHNNSANRNFAYKKNIRIIFQMLGLVIIWKAQELFILHFWSKNNNFHNYFLLFFQFLFTVLSQAQYFL